MGSSDIDYGTAIAVDGSGSVYVAGLSDATWGSPVNAHAGNYDAFAAKLVPCRPLPVLSNGGLAILGASFLCIVFWAARRRRMANA